MTKLLGTPPACVVLFRCCPTVPRTSTPYGPELEFAVERQIEVNRVLLAIRDHIEPGRDLIGSRDPSGIVDQLFDVILPNSSRWAEANSSHPGKE